MQVSVSELQESLASFKKVCAAMVLCMMLTQMMLLYYVSAISSNNTATAKYAQYHLTQKKYQSTLFTLSILCIFCQCPAAMLHLQGDFEHG